LWFCK